MIDVNVPSSPEVVYISHLEAAREVAMGENYLYVVDWDDGLRVLGVGDPSAPVILGVSETTGNAADVEVSDGIVYVADDWAGLAVFRECPTPTRQPTTNRRLRPDAP